MRLKDTAQGEKMEFIGNVVRVCVCEREIERVWFLLDFVETLCVSRFSGNSTTTTNILFSVLSFACSTCSTRAHLLEKET